MFHRRTASLLLMTLVLAACGDGTSHTSIISSGSSSLLGGGINLRHDQVTLHVDGSPDAVIDPTGNFSIDHKPVALSTAQRALLQDYYRNTLAVRQHGIATGKAGVAIAGQAISSVVKGLAHGDTDNIDKEVDAKTRKVTQEALKICGDLANIKSTQDSLATQLLAFKPYAGIVDDEAISDCRSQDSDD
jgi:hypothetical protein